MFADLCVHKLLVKIETEIVNGANATICSRFVFFCISSCGRDLLCSECNFAVIFVCLFIYFFGFLEECKRHICFKIAYHLLHRLIHKPTSTITMFQAMSTIRAINLVNNITTTTLRFAESSGLQFLRHQASMWFLKWNLSHIISIHLFSPLLQFGHSEVGSVQTSLSDRRHHSK